MKKIFFIFMALISLPSIADYCADKKPNEKFFDQQYILDYAFAPNWDDLCYEQSSVSNIEPCYLEAQKWEQWFQCKENTAHTTLNCTVEGIDVHSSEIAVVKLKILRDGLAVEYKYSKIDRYFTEFANSSTPENAYEVTKDKIIFNLDGETFGKLASFDNGQSFEGRAVISQDFPVFLTCKKGI